MESFELMAIASEEARRLYEKEFSYFNPYTREIEDEGIPAALCPLYYQMVEEELRLKGEAITRHGKYFKIDKYQRR